MKRSRTHLLTTIIGIKRGKASARKQAVADINTSEINYLKDEKIIMQHINVPKVIVLTNKL